MVGDGVSLDPVSQSLVSPCDGTITQIHSAGHAVTITTAEGVEVLMHIGLDTVMLKGKGFTPRVKTGETVTRGDVLIDFDADFVATHARSLLTQIVVTNMGLVRDFQTRSGDVVAGQDVILDVTFECAPAVRDDAGETLASSPPILIPNPAGLHARPAALLANAAKNLALIFDYSVASSGQMPRVWLRSWEWRWAMATEFLWWPRVATRRTQFGFWLR